MEFFIFTIAYFLSEITKNKLKITVVVSFLFIIFGMFVFSNKYFAWDHINQQTEFITNYGTLLQEGTVINLLSKPSDTLFLDDSDDLIYWQAKIFSKYKYSWYTSSMPAFSKFTYARIEMFKKYPPDFYL